MLTNQITLVPGESTLGQYQVAIVRYTASGWVPTVPPLNAVVTNFRIVLQPQTRRRYDPATIPSTYVMRVSEVQFGNTRGVRVALRDGLVLYLQMNWSDGDLLADAIKKMLISPVGKSFALHPTSRDLSRLLHFIQQL